ncbi:right-handed parallel beta-helix repeat-containing protein [Hyalangium sp.]|uniref:right-handed parallel beta-helix repeat-containing protein n=1 Tax=Hyalangium sp. TaxID=2028555 RepID=UPI002D27D990|nr:right-handed parallel beta-helix repeat-containing protein [Hyalangium sp.]HYH95312.1 right-handed parallel beta-helix repeat-containing protein [Hyalangium sp.]
MKGSDVGKGTVASPLRTLGRAASLARPGDVIRVLPGTYSEQLVLESHGEGAAAITLRGEGPSRPTLMPSSNRAPGAIIFVRGRWNLENLHVDVDGAPMAAVVFLPGGDKSRLTGSELRDGTAGAGVIVQGARHIRIQDNVIHHFIKAGHDSHGVVVVGPSRDVAIRSNNIHHNSGDSIQCQGGVGPAEVLLIENNQLHDSGENGVDIKECNEVVIRNNQISGFPNATIRPVGSSAGDGVLVSLGARGVVIQGNTISKAGRGVSILSQVAPPEDIWVERNTIQNIRNFPPHNGQGIRIAGGRNVHVVENTIEGTASYGLMLAADGVVVTGLTVRNNRVKGGPQRMLVRLGRESFRPGFSMRGNHYARGGALCMDGVQEKFRGAYAGYRQVFLGEHLPLSSPERLDVWRLLVGADQGSALLE